MPDWFQDNGYGHRTSWPQNENDCAGLTSALPRRLYSLLLVTTVWGNCLDKWAEYSPPVSLINHLVTSTWFYILLDHANQKSRRQQFNCEINSFPTTLKTYKVIKVNPLFLCILDIELCIINCPSFGSRHLLWRIWYIKDSEMGTSYLFSPGSVNRSTDASWALHNISTTWTHTYPLIAVLSHWVTSYAWSKLFQ